MERKEKPGEPDRPKGGVPASEEGDLGEGSFTQSTHGDEDEAPSRQGPKRVPIPKEDERTDASSHSR